MAEPRWREQNGRVVEVSRMEDTHLYHALRMQRHLALIEEANRRGLMDPQDEAGHLLPELRNIEAGRLVAFRGECDCANPPPSEDAEGAFATSDSCTQHNGGEVVCLDDDGEEVARFKAGRDGLLWCLALGAPDEQGRLLARCYGRGLPWPAADVRAIRLLHRPESSPSTRVAGIGREVGPCPIDDPQAEGRAESLDKLRDLFRAKSR